MKPHDRIPFPRADGSRLAPACLQARAGLTRRASEPSSRGMLFSDILDSAKVDGGVWSSVVGADWLQGRSVFGGLQSAMALRAMRGVVPADVPLRVLQTTFVAPVPAGKVAVRARVLRTGKNVTHVEASILDGDATAALFVGVFGRDRPSRVEVAPKLEVVEGTEASRVPRMRPPGVAFAEHFSIRWLRGDPPLSGSRRTDAVIEAAMDDRAKVASEEHVVAIADFPPPLALSFLESPAFGSSVTWTLEMLGGLRADLPLEGWQLHIDLTAAGGGYTSQSVFVCGPGGEAVALSRQSMVVFG